VTVEPGSAEEKMLASPPDIKLGALSLWIAGAKGDSGWLDVGVRVGDNYTLIAEHHGMLLQKKDLIAFEPKLKELAEAETGEILLWSEGGSLTVRVKRYGRETGNYVETGLTRSIFDQKISAGFAPTDYAGALIGLRAVLTRLDEELLGSRPPLPPLPPQPWARPARQHSGAFTLEDYPAEAIKCDEEGITELEYTVSQSGEPGDVRLVRSSHFRELDEIAMRVVAERFRYHPALDSKGDPVPQRVRRKIAWNARCREPHVLDAAEVEFDYHVDGVGWFGVGVHIGAKEDGFGGGWLTDYMGDLLRAGIALASGIREAQATFNSEPFINRLEFEVVTLNQSHRARNNEWTANDACWVRLREIDYQNLIPQHVEFEGLCYSPLAVAEALYRMAYPLFEQNVRTDYPTFAALAAALEAARAG
jgi:TonB family protein